MYICVSMIITIDFVFLKKLAQHNKDLFNSLKTSGDPWGDQALEFYEKHTAQIEVRIKAIPNILNSNVLEG